MRSLPPPRTTSKRRWKRIGRAMICLFTKGYISDSGAFAARKNSKNKGVSIIRNSRFSTRLRKKHDTSLGIRDGASAGMKTASYMGKLAARASFPLLRPINKGSKLNFSVRF